MERYFIGGLDDRCKNKEILRIGDVNFLITNKMRSSIRDSMIDWGTFLEIYEGQPDEEKLFGQVIGLLNVKGDTGLKKVIAPLCEKIYGLSDDAHLNSMIKQYFSYEPMSLAMRNLFMLIKCHYETIVWTYVRARNKHIETKITKKNDEKNEKNDIEKIKSTWHELNNKHNLNSSSETLLFLNPPDEFKIMLNIEIKGVDPSTATKIKTLSNAINEFHYDGFCQKVPWLRLKSLLKFPVEKFAAAIKALDSSVKLPDYDKLEKTISDALRGVNVKKPTSNKSQPRKKIPSNLKGLDKVKWCMKQIFELRKRLLEKGEQYEKYYVDHAKEIIKITKLLKKSLTV